MSKKKTWFIMLAVKRDVMKRADADAAVRAAVDRFSRVDV